MRFAVMIEGQEDVGWEDWLALARTCERLGFEALFRSDHYLSVDGEDGFGALDAWGTICALAAVTTDLRLGTLVSPATFRHPSNLAKLAVTADHISGGRVELGLGTGWHDAEHRAFGFPAPSMDRMAEQLAVVDGIFAPGPFSFSGEHYVLEGLDALPKPVQQPLPLILGGAASAAPEEAGAARERLRTACEEAGRDPATLAFSLMHALVLGADEAAVEERAARLGAEGYLRGTPEQVVARLREYEAAGVERVFLQHLLFRDEEILELFAAEVVPAFS